MWHELGRREDHREFSWGHLKESDLLQDTGLDEGYY
jgi:hypothetical protein